MPNNFSFVIPGVLAGMERPGTFAKFRDDCEYLKMNRISAIVSLTDRAPTAGARYRPVGRANVLRVRR